MSIKTARKIKAQEEARQKKIKEEEKAKQREIEKAAKDLKDKEDMYREMFDKPTYSQSVVDQQQRYDDMMKNISYGKDDSVIKQANYEAELEFKAKQEKMYADMVDVDVRDMDTMHEEALKMNQQFDADKAMQQKEVARNSRIDNAVDDLFNVHSNSHEAHTALNNMNRGGFFDSQEDFQTAKARLTAKYDAKPTRASIPRPGVTREALERTEGYAIKTVKPGLTFKVNSNAKGELTGVGSMRGGTAGELADATVGNPYFKQVFNGRNLGAVLNLGFAINDFNEARDAGDGVIKAGVKAGAQFVAGEMLGGWMFPVMLAKQVPTMAISAIEGTQKITRQMNSTGRIQTFGEAQFQDTQQLATMRQAGMELAKMSQYNLQQSIMGNEAQYMHKL